MGFFTQKAHIPPRSHSRHLRRIPRRIGLILGLLGRVAAFGMLVTWWLP